MATEPSDLSCEVELRPGEKLSLPPALVARVGPGHWLVTVTPAPSSAAAPRGHSAFLHGYAPEDEGLYDDYPAR
ncbi:MAG TPA: hypothetical protein VHV77_05590 [Pirellulales bacterium]|nr:hypothetical protein [Pirellulales bacterium]